MLIGRNARRYTHGAHMGREYTRLLDKVVPEGQWMQRIRALGVYYRCRCPCERTQAKQSTGASVVMRSDPSVLLLVYDWMDTSEIQTRTEQDCDIGLRFDDDGACASAGMGDYIFGILASFGIGQAFSSIPNTLDCAACVDCHPREKVRSQLRLPCCAAEA